MEERHGDTVPADPGLDPDVPRPRVGGAAAGAPEQAVDGVLGEGRARVVGAARLAAHVALREVLWHVLGQEGQHIVLGLVDLPEVVRPGECGR